MLEVFAGKSRLHLGRNCTVSKHRYQPDWWRKRPFTVNYPFEDSFAFALLFE